jgi:glycosyltransferase involved in cell wall biosynthesis
MDLFGAICDKYAKLDSRVRVFHKENGGGTSARRLGVEESKGECISFVDSDDNLFPQSLSILIKI